MIRYFFDLFYWRIFLISVRFEIKTNRNHILMGNTLVLYQVLPIFFSIQQNLKNPQYLLLTDSTTAGLPIQVHQSKPDKTVQITHYSIQLHQHY